MCAREAAVLATNRSRLGLLSRARTCLRPTDDRLHENRCSCAPITSRHRSKCSYWWTHRGVFVKQLSSFRVSNEAAAISQAVPRLTLLLPRPPGPPPLATVTPVGDKPGQITREAIAEAEAAEDLADDDILAGNPSDWDYDESTEGDDEYNQVSFDEEDDNPPTPILDAYEKSRDPAEMERLIKMSFDSLPERAGPQRYNHKRREHQRYKTIRVKCCLL